MTDRSEAKRSWPLFAKLGCATIPIIGFAFLLFLAMGGGVFLKLAITLLTGWFAFLSRTLPKMEWNLSIAGMALLCSLIALGLGHVFFRSVAVAVDRTWRWRWTVCGFAAIGVLFLVGMSAGGIAHQIGWMASSSEELTEKDPSPNGGKSRRRQMSYLWGFRSQYLMSNSDLTQAITDFRMQMISGKRPAIETYHMFVILDETDENKYVGMLSFPRVKDPYRTWVGLLDIEEGRGMHEIYTEEELQDILEKYRDRLRPL